MNSAPLISIIVPIYNVEKYVTRCIESLIAQTHKNLEIILVNDGSSDGSTIICEEFAKRDRRIKVIHKQNEGVSIARNIALDSCNGEYILFVDGDDFISPSMTSLLYESLISSKSDISSCGYIMYYEGPAPQFTPAEKSEAVLSGQSALEDMLYQKNIAAGPVAKLYKSELFNNIRYPAGIKYGEDLDVTYRVLSKSKRVVVVPNKEYYYQQRSNSAIQAPFNISRMSSLKVLSNVFEYVERNHPDLVPAVKDRILMEAIFIISTIPINAAFNKEREECFKIIKEYRHQTILSDKSKASHRVLALISLLGPNALTHLRNMKISLKNTKHKLKAGA